jgi:hypothetical protein
MTVFVIPPHANLIPQKVRKPSSTAKTTYEREPEANASSSKRRDRLYSAHSNVPGPSRANSHALVVKEPPSYPPPVTSRYESFSHALAQTPLPKLEISALLYSRKTGRLQINHLHKAGVHNSSFSSSFS